jgi:hypothetical protein
MVPRVSIIAGIAVVPICAEIGRQVWRSPFIHEPIVIDDLAEISPGHVDEDAVVREEMADILAGRSVGWPFTRLAICLPVLSNRYFIDYLFQKLARCGSCAKIARVQPAEIVRVRHHLPVLGSLQVEVDHLMHCTAVKQAQDLG